MNKPELNVVYSNPNHNNYQKGESMQKSEPSLIIFTQLLLSLFHCIDREQPGLRLKTKIYLYDNLGQLLLPATTRDAFRGYLLGNRPLNLTVAMEDVAMKHIIQLLYEKMCSLFGPMNADTYLTRAMTDVERLPEAVFFHPRELL